MSQYYKLALLDNTMCTKSNPADFHHILFSVLKKILGFKVKSEALPIIIFFSLKKICLKCY